MRVLMVAQSAHFFLFFTKSPRTLLLSSRMVLAHSCYCLSLGCRRLCSSSSSHALNNAYCFSFVDSLCYSLSALCLSLLCPEWSAVTWEVVWLSRLEPDILMELMLFLSPVIFSAVEQFTPTWSCWMAENVQH